MKKQFLLYTAYCLLLTAFLMPAQAQPVSDANGVTDLSGTITNFSMPAGNDRLIVGCMYFQLGGTPSMTFNGNPMTHALTQTIGGRFLALFYRVEGNSGTATVGDVVASNSMGANIYEVGASSYHNVDQAVPTDGVTANTGNAANNGSLNVASAVGDLVCDCIAASSNSVNSFTMTQGAGQTEVWQGPGTGLFGHEKTTSSHEDGVAGNVTMSWTATETIAYIHFGMNLNVAPVLPVELLSFEGRQNGTAIKLSWQTASENKNDYFDIERSPDGRNFVSIGQIKGAGSTPESTSYDFYDTQPLDGINYYRLKQMDFDGASEYSSIVSVDLTNFQDLSNLKIMPNPVTDGTLTLSLPDTDFEEGSLELFDAKGVKVLSRPVTNQTTNLDVHFLPKGMYWLGMRIDREAHWEKVIID